MCGGTVPPCTHWGLAPGLSPRVRGNLLTGGLAFGGVRSIPACAGEPDFGWRSGQRPRVYPRVCGGTVRFWQPGYAYKGLSPRVRGNQLEAKQAMADWGSIPACAGEP